MTTKAEREFFAAVWEGHRHDVSRQLRAKNWSTSRISAALAGLTENSCNNETPAQTAARLQKENHHDD
jgi:hypothetical protein